MYKLKTIIRTSYWNWIDLKPKSHEWQ